MFWTMAQVKEANKANGQYFFSRDTMRFFASKVESKLYYTTQCFITSEKKCFDDYTRVYSVRQVGTNADIKTLARDLTSKQEAKNFIAALEEKAILDYSNNKEV